MNAPTPEEREFLALLPWYLNGTLGERDRQQCQRVLEASPRARAWLERERLIAEAATATMAPAAEEVGLARLRERLQAGRTTSRAPAPARPGMRRRWFDWLTTPYAAGALATAVAVQFVIIGVMSGQRLREGDTTREVAVREVRTLRVRFHEGVTEAQLRQALVAASAHIVGGPNQFGEYWLASVSVSVDEMRTRLEQAGVLESASMDTQGPQ